MTKDEFIHMICKAADQSAGMIRDGSVSGESLLIHAGCLSALTLILMSDYQLKE